MSGRLRRSAGLAVRVGANSSGGQIMAMMADLDPARVLREDAWLLR